MLLDGCQLSVAVMAAERIREDVQALAIAHEGSPFGVITLSIGVADFAGHRTSDARQLVAAADAALYEAKREGRNRVHHSG